MLLVTRAVLAPPALAFLHIHLHLHHHFHGPPVDYYGLAAGAFASWAGVPGPGEPLLIAAGVLAANHRLDIGSVILVAWAAATVGGIVGWLVGRSAGRAILVTSGPFRAARIQAVERGERIFASHPVIAVMLTPSWIAGINRVRPVIYQAANTFSALLWAAGIGLAAYLIGPTVIDGVTDLGTVLTGIVVAAVVLLVVLEWRRRRRRARESLEANS